jgi:uncharacterized protein (DUF433 family)
MNDLARLERMFYSDPDMLRNKPTRAKGQDLRTLPTYTIPEAASFLAVPRTTLHSWYSGRHPLLIASGNVGTIPLLSFNDLQEAYKVHCLRSIWEFSFQDLHKAVIEARQAYGTQHLLLNSEVSRFRRNLVLHLPARGRRRKQVVHLTGPRQLVVPEVVDAWGKRIITDEVIYPWRYLTTDGKSQPVELDPEVMSGRLVVTGTRIPVQMLWRSNLGGESIAELAEDYDLPEDTVKKALMHFDIRQKAA